MKNYNAFTQKEKWYDIDEKLSILKSYIHILENSKNENNNYDMAINYFRVLHNYLIIERMFYSDIVLNKREINKYLTLEKLDNAESIYEKFLELYDQNHIVRNNVELLDNIESVRIYLANHKNVFTELMKK